MKRGLKVFFLPAFFFLLLYVSMKRGLKVVNARRFMALWEELVSMKRGLKAEVVGSKENH